MGIREHTTYMVECDVCGFALFGDTWANNIPLAEWYTTQREAHDAAIAAGWTDDTHGGTKCPEHVGTITHPGVAAWVEEE